MDTPIILRFKLEEPRRAFLGLFPDENLNEICNDLGHFVFEAMNMVLGRNFLENVNRYCVNTDITS